MSDPAVLEITSDPNGIFSVSGLALLADPDATAGSYPVSYRVSRNGRVLLERSDTITVSASPYKAANAAGGAGWPGALLDFSGDHYRLTANADIENASADAIWYPAPAVDFSDVVSFTRAGAATYIDAAGVIRIAAADQPRFDYTHGLRGILLEGPATGLFGGETNPRLTTLGSVTTTNEATPFGDLVNGIRVASTGNPAGTTRYGRDVSLLAGAKLSLVWCLAVGTSGHAKAGIINSTTGQRLDLIVDFNAGSITVDTATVGAVTSTNLRQLNGAVLLEVALTLANPSSYLQINAGPYSAVAGEDVVLYAMQALSGEASSIIHNTTASLVARPADRAQLSEPVAALLRRGEATVLMQGKGAYGASGRLMGGAAGTRLLGLNAAQSAIVAGNATTLSLGAVTVPLPSFGAAFGYDGSGKRGSFNGGGVVIDATTMNADRTEAHLGRDNGGNFASGWYSQLVIWPFLMTNADLQARAAAYA
ncbi:hypothetical protein [Martelella sp. AMO21009]